MSNILLQDRIAYQIDSVFVEPEIITDTLLNVGREEQQYSQALECNTSVLYWGISNGELPAGLTLDANTGLISGIPTTVGLHTFTVVANLGAGGEVAKEHMIKVLGELVIETKKLSDCVADGVYMQTLKANDNTATFSISSGTLPDGLTLDTTTGEISGTPIIAGLYTFTVMVSTTEEFTATRELSIKIIARDDSIPVMSAVWSATNLPEGLELSSSGVLTGTPTATGTKDSVITVKTNWGKASKTVKIKVVAAS